MTLKKDLPPLEDYASVLYRMLKKQNDRYKELNALFSLQKWRSLSKLSTTLLSEQLDNIQVLSLVPTPTTLLNIPSSIDSANFQIGTPKQASTNYGSALEKAFKSSIGLATKAYQLLVHASVNLFDASTIEQQQEQTILEELPLFLKEKNQLLEKFQKQLEGSLINVYTSALQHNWDNSATSLQDQVVNFMQNVPSLLQQLVEKHNILNFAIDLLQKNKKMGDSERVGKLAVKYNHLIRKVIASVAGSLSLLLESQLNNKDGLLAQISKLAFDKGHLDDGRNKSIHQLPSCTDGEFVEITGMVVDMEVSRASDNKLICKMQLLDPSSKKKTWVIAYYSHLGHAGIEYQTFVTLHGKVYLNSPYNSNQLAVHLDKLNTAPLKQENWSFALLQAAKTYYNVWPNDLAIQWALSIHLHDLDKQVIYRAGAAELFFQPLYRGQQFKTARQLKYSNTPKN